jgi:hypothetical protein
MSEENTFFDHLEHKSKNTMIVYKRYYEKIKDHFGMDLYEIPLEYFKEYADNMEVSANTRAMYLNVYFLCKKLMGADEEELEEIKDYRNDLLADIQLNLEEVNNNLDLPDIVELVNHMVSAMNNKEYKKYIINYLLLNYHVRNLDLDVHLTADDTDLQPDKNYLLLRTNPRHVVYIRNVYKTAKKYGTKTHIIDDLNFYTAVRDLYDKDIKKLLLPSMHFDIMKNTFNRIGEGNYLKCVINSIRETGDLNLLKTISINRGSSYSVLLNSYNNFV